MRPRPATGAASFVDLLSCLPATRGSGTTVPVRQRSPGAPLLPVLAAEHDSKNRILRITSLQPLRWPAAQLAQRASCRGGRNARATGSALARVSNFPRQFTLENCQLPPASPQSLIRQALRFATYSLNPLSGRMLRPATEKLLPLVQKLWTIGLPCGSLRKTEKRIEHTKQRIKAFQ